MIPYFEGKEIIVDNESDRNINWGQGTKIFCRDSGKYYLIDEEAFIEINTGSSGVSGYSGYSGINGASGYSGYSGYSGDNPGSSGYSGISGYSGYSGYSGNLSEIDGGFSNSVYLTVQSADGGDANGD